MPATYAQRERERERERGGKGGTVVQMTEGGYQQQGEETADEGIGRKTCFSLAASGLFDMPREPPVTSSPKNEETTPILGADTRTYSCAGNSGSGGGNMWQPPRLEDFAGPPSGVFPPEAAVKMTDVAKVNDCRGTDEGSLLTREAHDMFTALPNVPTPASSQHVTEKPFESGDVTTSNTGCNPRVEQKESCGLQLKTGPSSATSHDPNQQSLLLLKGRQRRGAGHTLPRSSIPKPTRNHPTWRATTSKGKKDHREEKEAGMPLSFRAPTSRSPRTTSFSFVFHKEARRRRLNNEIMSDEGNYAKSVEDRPKPSVAVLAGGRQHVSSPPMEQRETSPLVSVLADVMDATPTLKTSAEEEPTARPVPPMRTPFFASRSTFIYADGRREETLQLPEKKTVQHPGTILAEISTSPSELLNGTLNSTSAFNYPVDWEKTPIEELHPLQTEPHTTTGIWDATMKDNPINHTVVEDEKKDQQQNDSFVFEYISSNSILPTTRSRWSNSPVYEIVAHAPSTQISTRAPSVMSVLQALPAALPPEQEEQFSLSSCTLEEKAVAENATESVTSAVSSKAHFIENNQSEKRRNNCPLAPRSHRPLPASSGSYAEIRTSARQFHAAAEAGRDVKVLHQSRQYQPKLHQNSRPHGDRDGMERPPPWKIAAQVKAIRERVCRSRETEMHREAKVFWYLWPEERQLWHSLTNKLTLLRGQAAELTKRISEWEMEHPEDTLAGVEKRLQLIQFKRQFLLTEWEKVEDLSWEYLTAQLLQGARKPLRTLMMLPSWKTF
ncbi:hypothetical protein MOQ_000181 [Trypanosoma cruzi marinkellei]|uniref:Uncharacterized protein n=1 Tax=Trypanosoma cruzi marinkellei TaxID=85056 RepID=K2MWL7_TRYCR|nr:hypothetical protein MOQ_000181 [Trypanosoma cruzi marinkellei]